MTESGRFSQKSSTIGNLAIENREIVDELNVAIATFIKNAPRFPGDEELARKIGTLVGILLTKEA
jgi:hypothetical protein